MFRTVSSYTVSYAELFLQGLLQKAELLLEQGDYENALNYFQKGARMRPDKDDFQDGIEKAKHGLSENHKSKPHSFDHGKLKPCVLCRLLPLYTRIVR